MQIVAKIKTPKGFDKLNFLIQTTNTAAAILKIIIFVKNLDKKMVLANILHNFLLTYMKNDGEKIIKIFTSILKLDAKKENLKDFCNSDIRIQISIDVIVIGVDIRNIVQVI